MNPELHITLLGTGTSQGIPVIGCHCIVCTSHHPKDKRLRTAAYVKSGDTGLSIDIGPDFRQQLLANRILDIHGILLTHEHNDHVSGLDDIRPINFLYNRDMPVMGSERTLLEVKRRFDYAFDPLYTYAGKPKVHAVTIDHAPFTFRDVHIIPIPVDHGDMPVLGYRIGRLAYVTDAKFIPESSMSLLQNLDVLILNGLRFKPHPTHLNVEDVISLCDMLKPSRCFLTHISHDMGLHAEAEKRLPDPIRLGYDGLTLRIEP